MTTPAGWYHDPSDTGAWRWWDGATWTAHVRQKAETAPTPVAVVETPQPAPVPVVAVAQPAPAQAATPVAIVSDRPPIILPPTTQSTGMPYTPSATPIASSGAAFHTGSDSAQTTRMWALRSPQTPGIWLLAFMPIIAAALLPVSGILFQILIDPAGPIANPFGATETAFAVLFAYALVLVISAWIFAGSDIRSLRLRGYLPPKIWWMLMPLSPLSYFIARGKVVRLEGRRAWPPELLFFMSIVIPIVLFVVGMTLAMSLVSGLVGTVGLPI
jgi:hypothetical protein